MSGKHSPGAELVFRLLQSALLWLLCSWIAALPAKANPYLPKPGGTPVSTYIATCATSGGFMHLYTALDQKIFAMYGIAIKHVVIQGGSNLVLAAMGADEIQFLYCAGDSTIPAMAAGGDAKLIASPLVGLPYVIIAQKDTRTIQDLKGKNIGIGSLAGLPFRLIKAFIKKFNLENVQIRPLGGSQPERYNALVQGIIQAAPFTPPLMCAAKETVSTCYII